MLKSPKPTTLRELISYLRECPQVTVQNAVGRKKTIFNDFDSGAFSFADEKYNFKLQNPTESREIGLTIGEKGFIVVCGEKSTTYYFGKC